VHAGELGGYDSGGGVNKTSIEWTDQTWNPLQAVTKFRPDASFVMQKESPTDFSPSSIRLILTARRASLLTSAAILID